ncbi:Asp-tRNA(Asn)/Glu-tRNA(Gln) amidotransferase subunit GatC [Candidatus Falkowbacteria bacterium]|nr:MAG: Asp-tRNA(Asn)/Glu-tRNA(Gln) amidotransferase subunit GatC [Candidatus Falkowbacteria bacterium]
MTLSEKEIRHIAHLARLQLTDKEIKQYRTELGGILRYVDQLQALSLKKKIFGTVNIKNTSERLDQVMPWDQAEVEVALRQAPDQKNHQIKVKRILE